LWIRLRQRGAFSCYEFRNAGDQPPKRRGHLKGLVQWSVAAPLH